jgi:hypothetical protein
LEEIALNFATYLDRVDRSKKEPDAAAFWKSQGDSFKYRTDGLLSVTARLFYYNGIPLEDITIELYGLNMPRKLLGDLLATQWPIWFDKSLLG